MAEVSFKNLSRGSTSAFAAQMWRIGSRLVLTPLILDQIGLAGFGAWTLVFSLCAYMDTVDRSFGDAYCKFTAEHDARRDYRGLAAVLGSGMLLVGLFGLLGLGVLWLARLPLLRLFNVPGDLLLPAGDALLVVGACLVLRMSLGCVFPVLAGLQRIDLRFKLSITASIIEFAASLLLLWRGWGLFGLAAGFCAGQLVTTALAWGFCRRLCPELRLSPACATAEGLRRMVALGGRFQLLHVLIFASSQGFRWVMAALVGIEYLAVFEIAVKILSLGDAVTGSLHAPLMPAFAQLYASHGAAEVQTLYERSSRLVFAASLISFGFLALFADRLVLIWTASSYPLAAWTVRCLAAAYVLKQLTAVGTASLRGRGAVGLEVRFALINSACWLLLVLPAHALWGYHGVVLTAAVSLGVSSMHFLSGYLRGGLLNARSWLTRVVGGPLAVLGPGLLAAGLLHAGLGLAGASTDRLRGAVEVGVWAVVFALGMIACLWYGVLSTEEQETLRRALPARLQGRAATASSRNP